MAKLLLSALPLVLAYVRPALAGAPSWGVCGGISAFGGDQKYVSCDNPVQQCTRYDAYYWGCADVQDRLQPAPGVAGPWEQCGGGAADAKTRECIGGYTCTRISAQWWQCSANQYNQAPGMPFQQQNQPPQYQYNQHSQFQGQQNAQQPEIRSSNPFGFNPQPGPNLYETVQTNPNKFNAYPAAGQSGPYQMNAGVESGPYHKANDPFGFNTLMNERFNAGSSGDSGSGGLSFAGIVMICVGAVVGVAFLVTLAVVAVRHRRRKAKSALNDPMSPANDSDARFQKLDI